MENLEAIAKHTVVINVGVEPDEIIRDLEISYDEYGNRLLPLKETGLLDVYINNFALLTSTGWEALWNRNSR